MATYGNTTNFPLLYPNFFFGQHKRPFSCLFWGDFQDLFFSRPSHDRHNRTGTVGIKKASVRVVSGKREPGCTAQRPTAYHMMPLVMSAGQVSSFQFGP